MRNIWREYGYIGLLWLAAPGFAETQAALQNYTDPSQRLGISALATSGANIALATNQIQDTAFQSAFLEVGSNLERQLLTRPESLSFSQALLVASGVVSNLSTYETWLSEAVQGAKAVVQPSDTRLEKAHKVFDYMHKEVLHQYNLEATTLSMTLKSGLYNCLSATALYHVLLEAVGITDAQAVVLPGHVLTSLDGVFIENTTPQGFDMANSVASQAQIRALTDYAYEDVRQKGSQVDNTSLPAYIYYNRSAFAFKKGRVKEAFQHMLMASELLPEDSDILDGLETVYVSYARYLSENRGKYVQAMQVAEEATERFPRSVNMRHLLYNTVLEYMQALASERRGEELVQLVTDLPPALQQPTSLATELQLAAIVHLADNRLYQDALQVALAVPEAQRVELEPVSEYALAMMMRDEPFPDLMERWSEVQTWSTLGVRKEAFAAITAEVLTKLVSAWLWEDAKQLALRSEDILADWMPKDTLASAVLADAVTNELKYQHYQAAIDIARYGGEHLISDTETREELLKATYYSAIYRLIEQSDYQNARKWASLALQDFPNQEEFVHVLEMQS